LMECIGAEFLGLVDGVGLADGIVENLARLGDVVDRELHRRRQAANNEIDLVALDQFERAGGGFAGFQLVVAHQQFGLTALEAAALVEFGDRHLRGAISGVRGISEIVTPNGDSASLTALATDAAAPAAPASPAPLAPRLDSAV